MKGPLKVAAVVKIYKEPGTNIVGLFKYPKSDTSKDHISELLAADIGQSICVD